VSDESYEPQIGDVVELKSGSFEMTVIDVSSFGVVCRWKNIYGDELAHMFTTPKLFRLIRRPN